MYRRVRRLILSGYSRLFGLMCMACPKKVVAVNGDAAVVTFRGERGFVKTPIKLKKGDYVLCQRNIVVQKISEEVAKELLDDWKEMEMEAAHKKGDESHA